MTNVMSSRRGCYDAVISGVIGPGQRGGSGGGHAKRGLRPQGAPAPQRGHCLRRRCRLRGAGAPSSRRQCQSLLGRRRGGTPPRAETGAYAIPSRASQHPQARKTPRSETTKHRRRSRGAGAPSSRRLCQSLLGRRRGGTPPRSVTAELRFSPYLCILMRENPVFSLPPPVARPRSCGGSRLHEVA